MAEAPDEWLEQIKAGEPAAVQRLLDELSGPVRRYLEGMLHNPAQAEDLAQEALVRLLQHLGEFRQEASLRTYTFQIAHNLALNHLAAASTRREEYGSEEPLQAEDGHQGALEMVAAKEDQRRVRQALKLLAPQQRAVVILRAWEDMSFKEIARVMGLAEGTAKAHYFFALRNLRHHLEAKNDA
ncbi:MAG: RNA polymerase sigma factor [Acidobacteria bacterium]|jgi:RNA polymerase sigma-70 factor (ECF subfamily)|nr:RNA polymerase sigma factor [Acidobacteriota bacterium]